jgi:hypothetical protein
LNVEIFLMWIIKEEQIWKKKGFVFIFLRLC